MRRPVLALVAPTLVVPGLLAGCPAPEGATADDLLEAVTITASGDPVQPASEQSLAFTGTATITADGRDLTLALDTADGPVTVSIHSPGEADLSRLDGETLTVTVPSDEATWGFGSGLALVEDAAGPAWAAVVAGADPADADAVFGEGFVTWGEDLGKGALTNAYDEEERVVFTTALVRTDAGPVELYAGDSAWITLDGQPWRFTLIAAYRFPDSGGLWGKCLDAPDVLSFELVRGEAPGEDRVLARPADLRAARSDGC